MNNEPVIVSEEQREINKEFLMKHGFNKGDDLIQKMSQQVSHVIGDLDVKLDRVLRKQEHDYLHAYSIYICQKEGELRTLI